MKKWKLSQLAGKQVMGPGIPAGEVKYEKKLILSTVDPPMVEVTMGIDKVVGEGGGFMVKRNSKANPEVVTGIPVSWQQNVSRLCRWISRYWMGT